MEGGSWGWPSHMHLAVRRSPPYPPTWRSGYHGPSSVRKPPPTEEQPGPLGEEREERVGEREVTDIRGLGGGVYQIQIMLSI